MVSISLRYRMYHDWVKMVLTNFIFNELEILLIIKNKILTFLFLSNSCQTVVALALRLNVTIVVDRKRYDMKIFAPFTHFRFELHPCTISATITVISACISRPGGTATGYDFTKARNISVAQ